MVKMDAKVMTAEQLIKRYGIRDGADYGHPGTIVLTYRYNVTGDGQATVIAAIKAKKPEIKAIFAAKKAAKEEAWKREAERQAKIDALPGLREILEAQEALADYRARFNRSFDGEYAVGGMGVGPRPTTDIAALRRKYPAATAYLRADGYANKTNWRMAEIGAAARERIINNPGDYAAAIKEMEDALAAYAAQHMWD